MSAPIELSWPEYDFLWEHFGLGVRPVVLDIESHGYTGPERLERRGEAWKSLAARGLGVPGDFHSDLKANFGLLARPEWEIDARLHLSAEGPRTSALLAASGARAVIGVLEPGTLTLRRVPGTGLARSVAALLPPHRPGSGASITLPAKTLDMCAARAGSNRDALLRGLISEGLGKEEARKIVDVVGDVVRFGHFGVARTPSHGKRRRAGHVVSVYDSSTGRYLFTRRPSGGTRWVTLSPGTEVAIVRQIDELIAELVNA
ncbi:ESX secretion-associated protein EspG [Actinokineospora sp.]|uniref:ESX secretion-associated protein EspG n=1 Tax=Actinokineospora sp. TaxID=1872133 RepID=UPI004037BFC1